MILFKAQHRRFINRQIIPNRRLSSFVSIGDTKHPLNNASAPPLAHSAQGYLSRCLENSPSTAQHLRWMLQKDALQQDFCLVGPPGESLWRRQLALAFCELLQRPVSLLTLTADLTESDLKQQRELVVAANDHNLQLTFVNAAPVRAAMEGHVLILDGIEKASRNVLPTLNNLLEHRSMNLEDGTLLIPPSNTKPSSHSIPVHPDFRVVATAIPSPPFRERPLDPPLRSRFQMRRVSQDGHDHSECATIMAALQQANQENEQIWSIPWESTKFFQQHQWPQQHPQSVLMRTYPVGAPQAASWESCQRAWKTAWKQSSRHKGPTCDYQVRQTTRSCR